MRRVGTHVVRNSIRRIEDVRIAWENLYLATTTPYDLIMMDDIFPQQYSGFRIAEYNSYLEQFQKSIVYSTGGAFRLVGEPRSFAQVRRDYEQSYPQYKERVILFHNKRKLKGRLAYVIFANNLARFFNAIEKNRMPFVFTLYPGGGFRLNDHQSDETIRRACASPFFRKVITTQKVSYDYLLDRQLCPADKMQFIYGGVFPIEHLISRQVTKRFYQKDKETFDICFVATKYMPRGIDKGYDVFIDVAKSLTRQHHDIRFHVVGPFDASDIDVSDLQEKITFYGPRKTDFFPEFYASMDIILSPNVPFVLKPGAFDGFPTGACVEAGLCGVAVFCTDILNLNVAFADREEIVIVPHNSDEICHIIATYYAHPDDLYRLAARGQQIFQQVFSIDAQMRPRIDLLSEYLR